MSLKPQKAVEVMFSYSHRDQLLRNDLEKHLSHLKRSEVISAWHDRKITAGDKWEKQIEQHLESADIILLLVTADFLHSDYCDKEMRRAIERHRDGEARVIPIILRHCAWQDTPLGTLQALPRDGDPVIGGKWKSRDQAFTDVARGLGKAITEVVAQKASSSQWSEVYLPEANESEPVVQILRHNDRFAETLRQAPSTIRQFATSDLEVATLYQPALDTSLIGSDFYDMFPVGYSKAALIVGDVAGKGLLATRDSIEIKFMLRALMREHSNTAKVLSLLNNFACDWQSDGELRISAFVTLSVAIIDWETRETAFSIAGMEPPLILRAAGHIEVVEQGGLPIGIVPETAYGETSLHLNFGDTLLMATDGVTEARNGDRYLGYEGMARLLKEASSANSLEQMGQAILERARNFAGGALHDEACLLLARIR